MTSRLSPHTRPSGHNARFDFHFLNAEFARARWQGGLHSGVCTLALARKVLGGASGREGGSYRLGDLVQVGGQRVCWLRFDRVSHEHPQRLSLNATNSHRAHDDAHATALLLRLLLREAEVTAPLCMNSSLSQRLPAAVGRALVGRLESLRANVHRGAGRG
jgi:DNA polymerase III epsilon subunit-like protein